MKFNRGAYPSLKRQNDYNPHPANKKCLVPGF